MKTPKLLLRKSVKNKITKVFNILAQVSLVFYYTLGPTALLLPQKTAAATMSTTLTVEIRSWDKLGVDSNNPVSTGPHRFLVQARVKNTGATPATNVQTNFVFGSGTGDTYLGLVSSPVFPLNTISPGASKDTFYVVSVTPEPTTDTPSNPVFDTSRPFTVTASSPDASDVSVGQTLTIKHINSQERNHILSSTVIPANPLVGQPFTVHVEYETSSTYSNITPQLTYDPGVTTLDSVVTNYVDDGVIEDDIYAQNHGNHVHSDFHFRALSTGTLNFFYTVLDNSGNSYHYNQDFSNAIVVPVAPRQALEKSVDRTTANPGDALTYTLDYSNLGNIDLTNVTVSETYDSHFTFTSSTPVPSTGDNVWNIGTLPVGASGSITINGTLDTNFPVGSTTVHNIASMDSDQTDPVSATADTHVTVMPNGSLALTKIVDSGSALPDDFSFSINPDPHSVSPIHTSDGTYIFQDLPNGSYTVTEAPLDNYHVVSNACTNINVTAGQQTSCAIHNAINTGTVTLQKIVQGGDAQPADWSFTVNGVPGYHSGDQIILPVGVYPITESGPNGYTFTGASGVCGVAQGVVGVALYVTVDGGICTFTNTRDTGSLTVIKHVINDNGGVKTASDFTMNVTGDNVSNPSFSGDESGTTVTMETGSYSVDESAVSGYAKSFSGDCSGTIAKGEHKTCTITNNDEAASITLIKNVINNNGGNAGVNDFGLTIGNTPVTSGQVLSVLANIPYVLNEAGLEGYGFVSITGAGCPSNLGDTVSLSEGGSLVCTITNDDVAPTITLNKEVINNNGGTAGANDFGLTIGGTPVLSGQTLSVQANTPYALNEVGLTGYTFVSITGDEDCPDVLNGQVTLDVGENLNCIITNDDQPAHLKLVKNVINDNGGDAVPTDWLLSATGPTPISGQGGVESDVSAGTYDLAEAGGPSGYAASGWDCSGDNSENKFDKDQAVDQVTLTLGESVVCTITNDDIQPQLEVYKYVVNQNGATLVPNDFTLHVNGMNVSPDTFQGSDSGTPATLNQGDYSVTEDPVDGYTPVYSSDCDGSIQVGETKTCLVTNTSQDAHLIVIKHVINDNGGNSTADSFILSINGVTVPGGASFPGAEAPGTDRIVYPGSYSVTETPIAGYAAGYSDGCSGNIDLGETDICTITNDDVAPTITLNKEVINNNGGTAGANDFGLTIGGTPVLSGQTLSVQANTPYALNEVGLTGYTFVSITGDEDCPDALNGSITLNEGEDITCTITNDDLPATLTVVKHVVNEQDGTADASDFTMLVSGTNVSDSSFAGDENGTVVTLDAGDYSVSENHVIDYAASYSEDCFGEISNGQSITCTVTNTHLGFGLAITKSAPETTTPGAQYDYTLNWSVSGNTPVSMLTITDPLPANTTFVSASNGGTESSGVVTWYLGTHNSGDSGTVTFTVQVNTPLANGTIIPNTAELCGNLGFPDNAFVTWFDEITPIRHCSLGSATTTIRSAPILSINKTDTPDPVKAGNELTYQLAWSVSGNSPAANVLITDTLPNGTTFVSADNSGNYAAATRTVTWSLGNHVPGDSGTVTLKVTTAGTIIDGTTLANTATINSNENVPAADIENTLVTNVPILALTKTVDTTKPVNPGAEVHYTVTVKNTGFATAKNLVLSDIMPNQLFYSDVLGSSRTFVSGSNLAAGDTMSFTYPVTVKDSAANGSYVNTATLSSDNYQTLIAQATIMVTNTAPSQVVGITVGQPKLSIEKTVGVPFANAGDTVPYTVKITNIGDAPAINLTLTDVLPVNFVYVETGSASRTWSWPRLEPGQSTSVDYLAVIAGGTAAGLYENVASAQADNAGEAVARQRLEVRAVEVLGAETGSELPKTGPGSIDYLIFYGLGLASIGAVLHLVRRKEYSSR